MYKILTAIERPPETRDKISELAAVKALTKSKLGCIAAGFFTCTNDPEKLMYIECFVSKEAHKFHYKQEHTRKFIAHHEQFHKSLTFETVNTAPATN